MRITNEPEHAQKGAVFQQETPKTFRQLDFSGKTHYIWDYYKWWFIFGFVFLLIAAVTIPSLIENHKESALYAVFVNTQILDQESTTLMDDFVEYADIDMDGKRITLDTSLIINRNRPDQLSMQSNQKLLALFSSKTPDVVVCDDENFQFYAEQGAFKSLEEVLPADLFEKYKPYMLTCNSKDSDQTIYYGIDIKSSPVLTKEKAYIVDPIFTICINASQPDHAIQFLEFLMVE